MENYHNRAESEEEYLDIESLPVGYTGVNTDQRATFLENTGQIDYTRPFGEKHTLELGAKYINRLNRSRTDLEYVGEGTDLDHFRHTTHVGAAYADYRVNLGKWGLRVGMRYEYSRLMAHSLSGDFDPYHRDFNDVVPIAALSFNANRTNYFRLTYGQYILRPGIDYLNPAVFESPNYTNTGNPDLSTVKHSYVQFRYSYNGPLSLDYSARMVWSDGQIVGVYSSVGDHIYHTYANAGSRFQFDHYVSLTYRPWSKTFIILQTQLSYEKIKDKAAGISNQGWIYKCQYFSVRQTLPAKFEIEAMVSANPRNFGLYSNTKEYGSSGVFHVLSLSKAFGAENRLRIELDVTCPFTGHSPRSVSRSVNTDYRSTNISYAEHMRSVQLTVVYRFGSFHFWPRRIQGIENTDLIGSGKKN